VFILTFFYLGKEDLKCVCVFFYINGRNFIRVYMTVRAVMLFINLHLSMTAKRLDPVVISAYVTNGTAKREPYILQPCSLWKFIIVNLTSKYLRYTRINFS
jgi:hypothetical protein